MSYNSNQTNTDPAVDIDFNAPDFPGNNGKFKGQNRRIERVEITDDNTGQTQTVPVPSNGKCTIKIYTKK
ncbi:MAG TPA: hypothetical protein VK363_03630 [Pyrinomonadaceae bacterium]|nr:hypothetical protein [Pyrinomonadaceae bacterium]